MYSQTKVIVTGVRNRKATLHTHFFVDHIVELQHQDEARTSPLQGAGHQPYGSELIPKLVVDLVPDQGGWQRIHDLEPVAVAEVPGDDRLDLGGQRLSSQTAQERLDRQGRLRLRFIQQAQGHARNRIYLRRQGTHRRDGCQQHTGHQCGPSERFQHCAYSPVGHGRNRPTINPLTEHDPDNVPSCQGRAYVPSLQGRVRSVASGDLLRG